MKVLLLSLVVLCAAPPASAFAVPVAAKEAYDRALDLIAEERFGAAREELEGVVALAPDWVEALGTLGLVLDRVGEGARAVRILRRALDLEPGNPDLHNNLGLVLGRLDRDEEAVAAFRRAVEARPDHAPFLRHLGAALKRMGRYEEALATHRAALALTPEDPELHFAVGVVHLLWARDLVPMASDPETCVRRRRGMWEEAVGAFSEALVRRPEFVEALNDRGTAHRLLGGHEEARADFEHSLAIDGAQVKPWFDLALAHEALGDDESALVAWDRFVRRAVEDAGPSRWDGQLEVARRHLLEIQGRLTKADGTTTREQRDRAPQAGR